LPLSYAVDAMQRVQESASLTSSLTLDVAVICAFILAAIGLGAATLRRRTP
jgi:ABC-2 type transport system permease protein